MGAPALGPAEGAPGLPLVGEGQRQEANEEETARLSQQSFIKRLQSYWEEAMMLDTPVEKRMEDQSHCGKNGR